MERNRYGKYIKTRTIWNENNWNNGYLDSKGRFRVYKPDYPRSYNEGYALRSHVVWWLKTGSIHPKGTVIHHKNKIKDDDRIENLELMTLRNHTYFHSKLEDSAFFCEHCHKEFIIDHNKVHQRNIEGKKIRFCSQDCYHKHPRSREHKQNISIGLRLAYQSGKR